AGVQTCALPISQRLQVTGPLAAGHDLAVRHELERGDDRLQSGGSFALACGALHRGARLPHPGRSPSGTLGLLLLRVLDPRAAALRACGAGEDAGMVPPPGEAHAHAQVALRQVASPSAEGAPAAPDDALLLVVGRHGYLGHKEAE